MASLLNRIQQWLLQPWRIVGFVSCVVGVSCYALSSNFNRLLGHWNPLKISLYIICSAVLSIVVLFAKEWPRSSNPQVKAHFVFLVLIFTFIYTFFSDKQVKKPDAYGPVSFAAFAVMSWSVSRQSNHGFVVEFLYFFLGELILELMKIINWWYVILGATFSYILFTIILRLSHRQHHLPTHMQQPSFSYGLDQDPHDQGTSPLPALQAPTDSEDTLGSFKIDLEELPQLIHTSRISDWEDYVID